MLFESSMQRPFPADCSSLQKKVWVIKGVFLDFLDCPVLVPIHTTLIFMRCQHEKPPKISLVMGAGGFQVCFFPIFLRVISHFSQFSQLLLVPFSHYLEDARVSWDSPRVMWLLDGERCRADVNFRWEEVGQVGKNMSVIVRKCHLSGWWFGNMFYFFHILGIIIPTD